MSETSPRVRPYEPGPPAKGEPTFTTPFKHLLRQEEGGATSVPHHEPTTWVDRQIFESCSLALRRLGGSSLARLGITSTVRGEGRSTIAVAMAAVQRYEYERRTLVIELDLDAPSMARRFAVAPAPGVAEVIREGKSVEGCLHQIDDSFAVLVAGAAPERGLLFGHAADRLMSQIPHEWDVVVVDLPPLSSGPVAARLAELCGAVTLVVRSGAATIEGIESAVSMLQVRPAVLLNRVIGRKRSRVRRLIGLE